MREDAIRSAPPRVQGAVLCGHARVNVTRASSIRTISHRPVMAADETHPAETCTTFLAARSVISSGFSDVRCLVMSTPRRPNLFHPNENTRRDRVRTSVW